MGNDLIFGIVYLVDYGNELHDSIRRTMNIVVLQMDFKMLVKDALIFVVIN